MRECQLPHCSRLELRFSWMHLEASRTRNKILIIKVKQIKIKHSVAPRTNAFGDKGITCWKGPAEILASRWVKTQGSVCSPAQKPSTVVLLQSCVLV